MQELVLKIQCYINLYHVMKINSLTIHIAWQSNNVLLTKRESYTTYASLVLLYVLLQSHDPNHSFYLQT